MQYCIILMVILHVHIIHVQAGCGSTRICDVYIVYSPRRNSVLTLSRVYTFIKYTILCTARQNLLH